MAGSFWFLFTARLGLEPMLIVPAGRDDLLSHAPRADRVARCATLPLAGVPAAATVYTYLAGRALFLLAPTLLLHEVIAGWLDFSPSTGETPRRAHWRNARGLALSSAVMLALSLPILWYVRANAAVADQRLGELGGPMTAALRGDLRPVAGQGRRSGIRRPLGRFDRHPLPLQPAGATRLATAPGTAVPDGPCVDGLALAAPAGSRSRAPASSSCSSGWRWAWRR